MITYICSTSDNIDDSFEFESEQECHEDRSDREFLAQLAAEDYHDEHDGWEDSWPVTLTIWLTDRTPIGKFKVDREYEPVFCARAVKEEMK